MIFALLVATVSTSAGWTPILSDVPTPPDVELISSDIETTSMSFHMDGFVLEPIDTPSGVQYRPSVLNGVPLLSAGDPDMHKLYQSIIIPDDAQMQITVTDSTYHEFTNIDVLPSKGVMSRLVDPTNVPFEYGPAYGADAFFPGSLAELQTPYILRDFRAQAVWVYPFQYNPVTGVLRVYSEITVSMTKAGPGSINVIERDEFPETIERSFGQTYQTQFINFNGIQNVTRDGQLPYLGGEGSMLVICAPALCDSMTAFVSWKNAKGLATQLVSTDEIGTDVEQIQTYVADYYDTVGLTYLLLVGDWEQIEAPLVNGSPSDPTYGFLDGDDAAAEVMVGRLSGDSPEEIDTQVQRIMEYERMPSTNNESDWHITATGIASNEGPGINGWTDDEFQEHLWDDLLSSYHYELFESFYDPSSDNVIAETMDVINAGTGIINYTGHSTVNGWANGAPLTTDEVHELDNAGMLPFVITVGCNAGEYNAADECFAESWLRSTNDAGDPIGAIAHFASTISQSWQPPMHGQWGMNALLTESGDGLLIEDDAFEYPKTLGAITTNGCIFMNDAAGWSGINETTYWTFFGDPSVEIRTLQPEQLDITHPQHISDSNADEIIITVQNGDESVVNDALVSLSQDGILVASAYTYDGEAFVDISDVNMQADHIDLVVTKYNHTPYESTILTNTPDVNGDGITNILDIQLVMNMILGIIDVDLNTGDLTADGEVNILDVLVMVTIIIS